MDTHVFHLYPSEVKELNIHVSNMWEYTYLATKTIEIFLRKIKSPIEASPSYILKFIIDKKSTRCFLYQDTNKYITYILPFRINYKNVKANKLEESFYHLDSPLAFSYKLIRDVEAILYQKLKVDNYKKYGLLDFFLNNGFDDMPVDDYAFYFLEAMLTCEPGYVRHDNDLMVPHSKIHPQTHLDINFSECSTFKIGTSKHLNDIQYEQIFNNNSERPLLHFIP